ncbi:hypothetical protein HYW68_02150 [Candidatus Parcubacteria bacterium]|nr:hypothetical protein [Candidatus Parcubacteria bacterium]
MEAVRERIGGRRAAGPAETEAVELLVKNAKFVVWVQRLPGGEFVAEAEYPRPGTTLAVIAILDRLNPEQPRLVGEIGLGFVRPYRPTRSPASFGPRSRPELKLPTQAWEAIAPRIVECLRDAVAHRIETRWENKEEAFRLTRPKLKLGEASRVSPVVNSDGEEEKAFWIPWRGIRATVDQADQMLVDLFNSFDVALNPELHDRLLAFASALRILIGRHRLWDQTQKIPAEVVEFLGQPYQRYFYRPSILTELFRVCHRPPPSAKKAGRSRHRSGYPLGPALRCVPEVLNLLVRVRYVTPIVAQSILRIRESVTGSRNPFAPFVGYGFGQAARDAQVCYPAIRRGPDYSRRPGPRQQVWREPSYLTFMVRLDPDRQKEILMARAAERKLFEDLDLIIQGG